MTRTCEDYHALDLAVLQRQKRLTMGQRGRLTWSIDGEAVAAVKFEVRENGMRLCYRFREYGNDWRDIDEVIPFTFTSMNFGGRRRWFLCPSCNRRCRVLYGGSVFRCRVCHALRYESQDENVIQRAMRQQRKLRARLGCDDLDDEFPARPKGMWRQTYARLEAKDEALDGRSIMWLAAWMDGRG